MPPPGRSRPFLGCPCNPGGEPCHLPISLHSRRIGQIVRGERAITAATDIRLSIFFGTSEGYWLRLQAACDLEQAHREDRYDQVRQYARGLSLEKMPPGGSRAAMRVPAPAGGARTRREMGVERAELLLHVRLAHPLQAERLDHLRDPHGMA
jgi:hypothetical protein